MPPDVGESSEAKNDELMCGNMIVYVNNLRLVFLVFKSE